jgi:hydroxymethylglutaryl-CoA reductase
MKVGTVGGSLETNPTVRINHRLLGSPNAAELASVMGAVGLAQNYAALRALTTSGIQQNHMTLHARSVASTAQVPEEHFDTVVDALIESGDIKVWNAQEILKRVQNNTAVAQGPEPRSYASGKIILLGEHAVVYGRPALAAPIPLAVEARVVDSADTVLLIPRWGIEQRVPPMSENPQGVTGVLALLLERLDLASRSLTIEAFPNVPRAMGLGGSSALAVAVIRALSNHFKLDLSDERVNELAFECERAVHGTPSGVDNTIATYGSTLLFENKGAPSFQEVRPARSVSIAIGISGKESLTATTVARVRRAWERQPQRYERIFDQIGDLTRAGTEALQDGAYQELGELMNLCHGYLNALQVSTPELEELIHIARRCGAVGAKLTGGGGGGSVIALCPDGADDVVEAMQNSGFEALAFDLA